MATISATYAGRRPTDTGFTGEASVIAWPTLANGDFGAAVQYAGMGDRSIQFHGTFGTGGTVVLQGSNDGSNWYTLTDPQGNAISKTAAGLEAVSEATAYVRPYVSAGDGTTSITATLFARG